MQVLKTRQFESDCWPEKQTVQAQLLYVLTDLVGSGSAGRHQEQRRHQEEHVLGDEGRALGGPGGARPPLPSTNTLLNLESLCVGHVVRVWARSAWGAGGGANTVYCVTGHFQ